MPIHYIRCISELQVFFPYFFGNIQRIPGGFLAGDENMPAGPVALNRPRRFYGARPWPPLLRGDCQIAGFRQFDWGSSVYLPPAAHNVKTSCHCDVASLLAMTGSFRYLSVYLRSRTADSQPIFMRHAGWGGGGVGGSPRVGYPPE